MKKIICLFLMATTLTVASASATIHFEHSQVATTSVNDYMLDYFYGTGPSAVEVFGLLCSGTLLTAFAFGGPQGLAIGIVLGGISCGVGLFV